MITSVAETLSLQKKQPASLSGHRDLYACAQFQVMRFTVPASAGDACHIANERWGYFCALGGPSLPNRRSPLTRGSFGHQRSDSAIILTEIVAQRDIKIDPEFGSSEIRIRTIRP